MAERLISIPESTVKELADQAVFSPLVARRLRALLSQPTPTAEPDENFGGTADITLGIEDGLRDLEATLHGCTPSMLVLYVQKRVARSRALARNELAAEPPRIKDMAPGTTFVGTTQLGHTYHFEYLGEGQVRDQDNELTWRINNPQGQPRIDASTIRDVTPPAVQP